jgi:hypothetical protein
VPNVPKSGPIKEKKIHNLGDAICHIKPLIGMQYAKINHDFKGNHTQHHHKVKNASHEIRKLHHEHEKEMQKDMKIAKI